MTETDPIPLSALQHWIYCSHQCGLIHLEQAFGIARPHGRARIETCVILSPYFLDAHRPKRVKRRFTQ